MAYQTIKAGFEAGLSRQLPLPNEGYSYGDRTLLWGVDKLHDATVAPTDIVAYGEIVKITGFNDRNAIVAPIVNADTTPKFAVVVRTQDGARSMEDGRVWRAGNGKAMTIWPIGLGATPEKDQNGEIVVAYTGASAVGVDLTGTALYTPKLASDTNGVNGTATETSTNNLALGCVAVGKVFGTATHKKIRMRISGGKL